MANEKLYQMEDLNLAALASEVGLKSHQLSEFLNKHLDVSFSRFVNQFRIEKAIRLMREEPSRNLLDVAYQVGFASKATFNHAFKSIKQTSPTEFLKKDAEFQKAK